ncbi:unnamed protein product [Dicrocoelium dendriticum]|nr:unnamed protein product [Dicrocoelium dendriticum]
MWDKVHEPIKRINTKPCDSDANIKAHLYRLLEKSGELDGLKSRLRSRLISEMTKSVQCGVREREILSRSQNSKSMYPDLVNSLIADYLQTHDLTYTLSVFLPEVRMGQDKVLRPIEIMHALGLERKMQQTEYILSAPGKGPMSLSEQILYLLSRLCTKQTEDKEAQTEEMSDVNEVLDKIEHTYETRRLLDVNASRNAFDERVHSYQELLQRQSKLELDKKMEIFKATQMVQLKEALEREQLEKFQKYRKELEEELRDRIQTLTQREHELEERVSAANKSIDREAYHHRQKIETETQLIQLQAANLKQGEEKLQSLRNEDETRLIKTKKELELKATQLEDEKKFLETERNATEAIKADLMKQRKKYSELEIVDFNQLKEQNNARCRDLEALQSRLSEAFREIEKHKQATATAQAELEATNILRQEIQRLRASLVHERAMFDQERTQLQSRLEETMKEKQLIFIRLTERDTELSGLRVQLCELQNNVASRGSRMLRTRHSKTTLTREALSSDVSEERENSLASDTESEISKALCTGAQYKGQADYGKTSLFPHSAEWALQLKKTRHRLNQIQCESEQLESAYCRWRASSSQQLGRERSSMDNWPFSMSMAKNDQNYDYYPFKSNPLATQPNFDPDIVKTRVNEKREPDFKDNINPANPDILLQMAPRLLVTTPATSANLHQSRKQTQEATTEQANDAGIVEWPASAESTPSVDIGDSECLKPPTCVNFTQGHAKECDAKSVSSHSTQPPHRNLPSLKHSAKGDDPNCSSPVMNVSLHGATEVKEAGICAATPPGMPRRTPELEHQIPCGRPAQPVISEDRSHTALDIQTSSHTGHELKPNNMNIQTDERVAPCDVVHGSGTPEEADTFPSIYNIEAAASPADGTTPIDIMEKYLHLSQGRHTEMAVTQANNESEGCHAMTFREFLGGRQSTTPSTEPECNSEKACSSSLMSGPGHTESTRNNSDSNEKSDELW